MNVRPKFKIGARTVLALGLYFSVPRAVPAAQDRAAAAASSITTESVIQHLNKTIAWYEHVNTVDESSSVPQNVLLQDSVRQSARRVVQTAFAFARVQAALLHNGNGKGGAQNGAGQSRSLDQVLSEANNRVSGLQNQIDDLNGQIEKLPTRKQATLVSQRETLKADLNLAKEVQSTLKNMMSFATGSDAGSGLMGQINILANSDAVQAVLGSGGQAAAATHAATAAPTFRPETAGIMSLLTNCVTLFHARSQVDSILTDTEHLSADVRALTNPLRTNIRNLISQGDALAAAANAQTDPDQLNTARQQINAMTAKFKSFSGPILPLGEQSIALGATHSGLEQWRNAVDQQFDTALGYLGFRLGSLALVILILLVISNVIHRVTFRYVRDTRRRRQFIVLRRFAVGAAITLVIVLTLFSGFGSFATIAGFVTAGLAVALQNVILSIVAYFFLIGRYGLRVGDRVTVSGLSGQVLEVGLVRMYLMELAGTGVDVHSTGRVAVFSNSVIFQPAALIKQAPGTEYAWHSVSTILAPETELEGARKRVESAVEAVFNGYRKRIEEQNASFERSANIQLAEPVPVSRARFTEAGVEVIVRYPVEIQSMSEVDEQVIDSVMREASREPKLALAAGGRPKVLPATS